MNGILVVHRYADWRAEIERLLGQLGADVAGAGNSIEALGIVREQNPALVVLDAATGGLLLCQQVIEMSPMTSVILVSAEGIGLNDRIAALLVGADDFLGEPFDRAELLARARRSLDRLSRHTATSFAGVLSRREQQVLELLTHGLTQRQIAAALMISPKTAGTHVQHILSKLGVHSSAQAVAVALSVETTGHKSPAAQRISA